MTNIQKYSRQVLRHPGRFTWRVLKGFKRNQGLLLSGGVAYNSLLSIIPMLALILIGFSQFIEQEKLLEIIIKELELIVPGHAEKIADEVGALLMVDAAHFIGLVAGKAFPNPVEYADVVTFTTHKALRGPRGGLILCKEDFAKAIDKAVFPFAQGGAINNQIAAKALCFEQAGRAEFKTYANQIVRNAKVLAGAMDDEGLRVISGGTENHMFLVDLRSIDSELTGKEASQFLDEHGVTLNRNAIPFDPRSPFITSGLRLGTPSVTSAGMMQEQMVLLGKLIVELLRKRIDPFSVNLYTDQVRELAEAFPAYPADFSGHA